MNDLRSIPTAELTAEVRCRLYGRCMACDNRPATLLCDHKLGWSGLHMPERYFDVDNTEAFTCDASLCDECAHHAGMLFACGEAGFVETTDYCPIHAAYDKHDGIARGEGHWPQPLPLNAQQAQILRAVVWRKLEAQA